MQIQPLLTIYNQGYHLLCHKVSRRLLISSISWGKTVWKPVNLSAVLRGTMEDMKPKELATDTNKEGAVGGIKRGLEDSEEHSNDVEKSTKKVCSEATVKDEATAFAKRKKVAMLLMYSGKGYQGMQKNPGTRTIESDLMEAFVKAGVVTRDQIEKPGETMQFQRAARTDKGVSAAGQVVSLKVFIEVDEPISKINQHLCDQIKVVDMIRVTKKYDCKNAASARTYSYIMPTFTLCPFHQMATEDFRINEEILSKLNDTLTKYRGTHNFHNFTSGKKATDPSAKRYILDFKAGGTFVQDGLEFVVVSVKGQSFMLHQIRKMIGLAIAICRGLTGVEAIQKAFHKDKFDVPKAPGLGLILNQVHYDYYNKRFGGDGTHEPIVWDKHQDLMDEFKKKWIYSTIVDTEKEEKSMLRWMSTLQLHKYDSIRPALATDIPARGTSDTPSPSTGPATAPDTSTTPSPSTGPAPAPTTTATTTREVHAATSDSASLGVSESVASSEVDNADHKKVKDVTKATDNERGDNAEGVAR